MKEAKASITVKLPILLKIILGVIGLNTIGLIILFFKVYG